MSDFNVIMEASALHGFLIQFIDRETGALKAQVECSLDEALKMAEQIKETVREPLLHVGAVR